MQSTRLPGKILLPINGKPLIQYELERVAQSKLINKIVLATSDTSADDPVEALCKKLGIAVFRGSENDVLDRYYQCAMHYPDYDAIVRITGDCPLIDRHVIDDVIALLQHEHCDYASNIAQETFPDGMDIEVFMRTALEASHRDAKLASEHEHVTLFIRNHPERFRIKNLASPYNFAHFRLTVDEPQDFEVISFILNNSQPTDEWLHYISLLTKHPDIMLKNMHIIRNEGLLKSLKNDYNIK